MLFVAFSFLQLHPSPPKKHSNDLQIVTQQHEDILTKRGAR